MEDGNTAPDGGQGLLSNANLDKRVEELFNNVVKKRESRRKDQERAQEGKGRLRGLVQKIYIKTGCNISK